VSNKEIILDKIDNERILVTNSKTDSKNFSEIPSIKYFGKDLLQILKEEGKVHPDDDKVDYQLLIEDKRIIFLICSNVLKINKLLYDNYLH
jgi:hypothetical protein